MKILHTADLHLGQVIYQNYDRVDEHRHFFAQLEKWCRDENPDALLVSGDLFDIQQPSAATKKVFNEEFVHLHNACPQMRIVITAGNHDSASRIQADSSVWQLANTTLIGIAPAGGDDEDWQNNYIVKLDSGYIIAMPYMNGAKKELMQSLLDHVAHDNTDGKPVVLMGHLAVAGMDATGHDCEIGTIRTQEVASLGTGYDYCALGHIHKPQTIGYPEDCLAMEEKTYPSGVVRYSGSALHVSCDEKYPHTVSVVTIEKHGGEVKIRQLRIKELRHFHELPKAQDARYLTAEDALAGIKEFADRYQSGYIRLRIDYNADLPPNFSNMVYDLLKPYDDEVRFNPKHLWVGKPENSAGDSSRPAFEVAELQEMTNPYDFVAKTIEQYPGLDLEMVREAFEEVEAEIRRMAEEEKKSAKSSKEKIAKEASARETSTVETPAQ